MDFIAAKSILQKVKYGEAWFGIDYNVNLYKGCSHGCIYCDSRSSCYDIENFDTVRGKKDALAILKQELRSQKRKGIVGMGAMSDTDIANLIQQAARNNTKFIQSYFGMTLRENQRDYYYNKLDKHFPGLRAKYESTYGGSYECAAPNSKELYQQFTALCSRCGLLYKMADIIKAYKINKSDQQLTLFDF